MLMTGKTNKGERPMKTRITIAAAALAVTSLAGCVEMPAAA
jgi:hypothetical protein